MYGLIPFVLGVVVLFIGVLGCATGHSSDGCGSTFPAYFGLLLILVSLFLAILRVCKFFKFERKNSLLYYIQTSKAAENSQMSELDIISNIQAGNFEGKKSKDKWYIHKKELNKL